jgi:hypothetical protein
LRWRFTNNRTHPKEAYLKFDSSGNTMTSKQYVDSLSSPIRVQRTRTRRGQEKLMDGLTYKEGEGGERDTPGDWQHFIKSTGTKCRTLGVKDVDTTPLTSKHDVAWNVIPDLEHDDYAQASHFALGCQLSARALLVVCVAPRLTATAVPSQPHFSNHTAHEPSAAPCLLRPSWPRTTG